ncbi:hypothetical protein [Sphingomonas sp.]|uniref:hypothetical protein n=1 Tax=Sphingomonas sp. TaxID=28214 RepID=UPI002EDA0F16
MKKAFWAATAAAFVIIAAPAIAKDKKPDKEAVKVAEAVASVTAPKDAIKTVTLTWPVGVVAATPTVAADAVLPANTEIVLKMNAELNSKKAREGDLFVASVAQDVMLGNMVVIRKGTPANGVVTWRTGKGAFGKSAKMTYSFHSLELEGQRVPVSGEFRQEGSGNTGAAVGAVAAAGVIGGLFVTGRSAVVEQGRELKVHTTAAIPIVLPVVAAPAAPPPAAPAVEVAPAATTTN